ncbi:MULTISPECIES: hypothetical protein [Ramlibacter]|uniref:Uncharacterized protein n=1 Tax=Ramlibacter aquaticus TaxID=2780094 RepID=A0ABR9SBT1_9BURK|nr:MULTISPECIES: hypothetical protein [Ramlibacter]MBE7939805.1 hypothetical protein [Ramlibacter aquaticus]
MDALTLAWHLTTFAAPALALGLGVAWAGPWLLRRPRSLGLGWQFLVNAAAGLAALAAGLLHFGVDGKMASYAGLVAAVASCQWLSSRGWKG